MGRVKVDGLPNNMSIHNHGTSIELIRNWQSRALLEGTVLYVAVLAFIAFFQINFFGFSLRNILTLIILSLPLIIMWKNKTHILIQRGQVSVKHKPFPYLGTKTIPSRSIKQVYVKQLTSTASENNSVRCAQLKYFRYEVKVVLKTSKEITLLKGIRDHQQALFIEEEIEKFLRIEDETNINEFGSTPILGW